MKKYSMDRVNVILALCLMSLQFYDIYITLTAINLGGIETNPIVLFFMERFGVFKGLVLIKSLVLCLIAILILYNKERIFIRQLLIAALVAYIVVLGYVTASNYGVLF